MGDFDDRPAPVAPSSDVRALVACVVAAALVVASGCLVVAMRIVNGGTEPEGQNWWLVAWFVLGLAYTVAGTALLTRPGRRLLGGCFVVVGVAATMMAIVTQYEGYAADHADAGWSWIARADRWAEPLFAGVLAGLVPWLLLSPPPRHRMVAWTSTAVGVGVLVATAAGPRPLELVATWFVVASATAATAALAVRWWRSSDSGDPLAGWLFAGAAAAWIALVPPSLDLAQWRLPGRDVVWPVLLLATVPLLVAGAVIEALREIPSRYHRISHGVVEWTVLAAGIVIVYTGTVAGLGRLVGGSAPTWFLVVASGVIAVVIEPGRHRVRQLVDRLVYGNRDDPLAAVQRVVDHLGADSGDDLLPGLVATLHDELRLDAVAIDLRVPEGWQRAAAIGPATTHRRVVELHHRGDVVGRLVIGWREGPSLRERDQEILDQLTGPLSLAVGWVRLAADLRRSSVAIVSAREEERRRLRRDLHDGIGPALTGVSLGLRTAVRQIERSASADAVSPARALLERVADEVDSVVVELKRIVRDLRPTALDQLGLVGAVAEFTRTVDHDLQIHLTLPPAPVELPAAVEVAIYRIVTEAVTNVVRHARAASCWLTIAAGTTVEIDVVDDGIGIGDGAAAGVGLTAMRERASELGGTVSLLPNDPRGTRVHVRLPAALP